MTELAVAAFVMLFVTVGPFEIVPIFVSLTHRAEAGERRRLAFRANLIAGSVLVLFAFGGRAAMHALGIGFPAFRIAGGILLLLLSIDLLLTRRSGLSSITAPEQREAKHEHDISVFPLAIPLIAGPGAMTSVVLLMDRAGDGWWGASLVLAMLFAVLAINLAAMLAADRVSKLLGVTGTNVIARVSGILLSALAVQFMLDGIKASGLVD
jgi:multiple antibiotic resistance protein